MKSIPLNRFVAPSLAAVLAVFSVAAADVSKDSTTGLIGHWPLTGDCQDHSGHGHHGINHGVDLASGMFDGERAWIEVPASESLRLGAGDFTFSAWIHTEPQVDDAIGDVLDMFDSQARRGLTLSVNSSASGYLSQANDRHVYFGIDNARLGEWEDCGHPSPTSPYISNSMLVFQGRLYAATIDAATEDGWAHVWRYEEGQKWTDCGRVGTGRTTGVGPLLVHQGELYAVTTTYDWTRVREGNYDAGKAYRYAGGTNWVDCGTPLPKNRTLNTASSYRGRLHVGGGPAVYAMAVQEPDGTWREQQRFDRQGPRSCYPHASTRYNGMLFTSFQSAFVFDGNEWKPAGAPVEPQDKLQTHCFSVYQGSLIAGTWPLAKVARWLGGERWEELGRVGEDGTEVNSLVVYNGKLYGGSIPRSEVCRYDGQPQWTMLHRFHSPPGWMPVPPRENGGSPTREEVAAWSRVTSMTIHRGRLFAGIGSCTSSLQDAHAPIQGSVHSLEAGKCVSYDEELAPGWRHLVAVRQGGRLRLYVDGKLAAESGEFTAGDYDLTNQQPLRIGFGQTDYFHGKIREVRAWKRSLSATEVAAFAAQRPSP